MEDSRIVELYWARAETAISETAQRFGRYCHSIAYNILHRDEDAEECVSDTWLRAWNAMPSARPERLGPFLGRITRNLALDRYKRDHAEKRGGSQMDLALSELEGCIPATDTVELAMDEAALTGYINDFLYGQSEEKRRVFLMRYWYVLPIRDIAERTGLTEAKITTMLFRMRAALREHLEREGVTV